MRCVWKVTAGIIPERPEDKYYRRWIITSEEWERLNTMSDAAFKAEFPDGKSTFARFREAAYQYAESITDPNSLNWVRVDWIWL